MVVVCSVLRGTVCRPLTSLLKVEHTEPYVPRKTSYERLSASLVTSPNWIKEQATRGTYPTNYEKPLSKVPVPTQTDVKDLLETKSRISSNNVLPKHGGVFEMELGEDFRDSAAWHEVENEQKKWHEESSMGMHSPGGPRDSEDLYTIRNNDDQRGHDNESPPTSPRSYFLSLGSSHKPREAHAARGRRILEGSSKLDHKDAIRIETSGLKRVWT